MSFLQQAYSECNMKPLRRYTSLKEFLKKCNHPKVPRIVSMGIKFKEKNITVPDTVYTTCEWSNDLLGLNMVSLKFLSTFLRWMDITALMQVNKQLKCCLQVIYDDIDINMMVLLWWRQCTKVENFNTNFVNIVKRFKKYKKQTKYQMNLIKFTHLCLLLKDDCYFKKMKLYGFEQHVFHRNIDKELMLRFLLRLLKCYRDWFDYTTVFSLYVFYDIEETKEEGQLNFVIKSSILNIGRCFCPLPNVLKLKLCTSISKIAYTITLYNETGKSYLTDEIQKILFYQMCIMQWSRKVLKFTRRSNRYKKHE